MHVAGLHMRARIVHVSPAYNDWRLTYIGTQHDRRIGMDSHLEVLSLPGFLAHMCRWGGKGGCFNSYTMRLPSFMLVYLICGMVCVMSAMPIYGIPVQTSYPLIPRSWLSSTKLDSKFLLWRPRGPWMVECVGVRTLECVTVECDFKRSMLV